MQGYEPQDRDRSNKWLFVLLGAGVILLLGAAAVLLMRTQSLAPPEPQPAPVMPTSDIPAPLVSPKKEPPLANRGNDTAQQKPDEKPGSVVQPVAVGTIDPKVVAKFIDERFVLIKSCYERRLRNNPLLEGKIDVNINLAPSGTVTSVKKSSDTIHDAEMWGCMKKTIRKWKFPKPQGGPVEIAKLFSFKKTD